NCRNVDTVEKGARVFCRQNWSFSAPYGVFWPSHGSRRVHRDHLANDQVIEQHTDRCEMLFDGRFGKTLAELFDIRSDHDRLEKFQGEFAALTPPAELRNISLRKRQGY